MTLTKNDLKQIDIRIEKQFDRFFKMILGVFATKEEVEEIVDRKFEEKLEPVKQDIRELKDDVIGIRNELDTEHEIRRKRIEENTVRSKSNKRRIVVLEARVSL